jgi:hypothetical protein
MIFLVLLIVFILRVEEARRKGKRRMDCEQLVFSFMKATHNDY